MVKFGTGMLEASLDRYAKEYNAKIILASTSLLGLVNQESPYAEEHRVLIDLSKKHLQNIETAKSVLGTHAEGQNG